MLDVSSRKRNGRFVVSKYNSRYAIYGTRQSDLRTGNIAICCMFRYGNRYDFIVRPSDCTPRVILPSLLLPLVVSLGFLFFFVICTPNRAELLQSYGNDDDGVGGGGSSGSRKSQINPFVIPHRSFQPVRISTTSLLCHLRTLPKLFPFSLPSPYRPVKRDSTILLSLSVSSPLSPSDITLFSPFFFSYPFLSIPVVPSLTRSLFRPPLLFFVYLLFTYSVRVISPALLLALIRTQVSARHAPIVFVSFAFPARPSIETSSPFMRTIITISGAANYQLKWGSPGFETTFVTVGSANRNWSSCCGERDKEIY